MSLVDEGAFGMTDAVTGSFVNITSSDDNSIICNFLSIIVLNVQFDRLKEFLKASA